MAKSSICPYCGATLKKNALHCEHCLREIDSVAKKRHEDKIKGLQKERKAMKRNLPDKIVAFFSHKIAIVISILLVLTVIAIVISYILASINNAAGDNTEKKWLKQLEKYYQNEQYKELTEYVNDNYIYGYKFDKYTQVADAYYYYMKLIEEWEYYNEMAPKINADLRESIIFWILYYGVRGMREAEEAYTDKGLMGNEPLLKELYADIKEFLMNEVKVSEEIINELLLVETFNEEELKPYTSAVVALHEI